MEQKTVYLALGSNLGDRDAYLKQAILLLGKQVEIEQCSSFLNTKPLYVEDQPDFLNAVVVGKTSLDVFALLGFVKEIEREMGRVETVRFGARVIDVDILFYQGVVVHTDVLVVPHVGVGDRGFLSLLLREVGFDPIS
ncbi:MAG: 2-amino-4-hydroxy-6-hydroxymethyldihydropteridine diphosphokinase [bacterium]